MSFTLQHAVHSEIEIKKSRFLGCVEPMTDRDSALTRIAALKAAHPAAAHVCWALMAGGHSAANDDGEPSGTAGRPMLEVLRHQQLEGVLASVVRYYGGVKLGAGGLARAYTDSIASALTQAVRLPQIRQRQLQCLAPYPLEGKLRRLLQAADAQLLAVEHGTAVLLSFSIAETQCATLITSLNEACHGQLQWPDSD